MGHGSSRSDFQHYENSRKMQIIMVGLEDSGKTTLLYELKLGHVGMTFPKAGFRLETMHCDKARFTAWGVGGQVTKFRSLWRKYLDMAEGVIFVVDSSDRDRMDEARQELHRLVYEEQLVDVPVLVYANKQDLPDAMSAAEIVEELDLRSLSPREWFIQRSTATAGDGLADGLDWLATTCERIYNTTRPMG